jgi:phosphatidylinositol alpha-1,6-mannosyltransferase
VRDRKTLKVKILIAGNYFYPEHTGGVEMVSYNLIKYYREAGHSVCWVAADVPPRFRIAGPEDVPIRAWNIAEEKLGFPQPFPYPSVFAKLYNNIKVCDVVHLQDCLYLINIFTFFIAKLLRKPILITQYAKFIPYHQLYKRVLQTVAYHTVGWLMFTTANKVVFITANVRDNMQRINPGAMREVVPLGVDTDFYSPLPPSERIRRREEFTGDPTTPILLFVGRMVERKGIHLFRPLIEKHKEWYWILVGRPDDFNPAQWQYPNLTYFSYASEQQLRELYGIADLLVHPSAGEGVTLIASESMASGTPVVISEESLYELEKSDRELFFATRPELAAIEQSLIQALSNPKHLEEMRARCRDFATNRLSWRKMTEQYITILEMLLAVRSNKEPGKGRDLV